jgi:hypothetical protein
MIFAIPGFTPGMGEGKTDSIRLSPIATALNFAI